MPRYSDVKGNDFCRAPLSSSPFPPPPNCFGPPLSMPPMLPRFAPPPPGPVDGSPLCRPPGLEGFRYRSPIHNPNIPLPVSPYGSRVSFCNSPFGVSGPNGTPSSGSSYGDSGAGNFRQGGRKSWNGTPYNGNDMRRGMKRNTPSFRQYDNHHDGSDIHLYYNRSMMSDPWAGLTPVPVSRKWTHRLVLTSFLIVSYNDIQIVLTDEIRYAVYYYFHVTAKNFLWLNEK